ncbi:MAG: cation diffusion facilitator family transporter [Pegethrix bostrychoides GSE-TBD4-15B]|jgi:cation diffusion facilitator family transporter|uniref:Cation diffusion facilitator family transporter n=1 Tax=Pegethrix bostrychoides GSE-TBD4-15B TaxID=2839662 RepID=A0A951PEU6_9CYAN|nr:cation diffusion facilitator family transporter [Pegethrix bostrychoides GSE-TBD4-15B]
MANSARSYAVLSIVAALCTIALKGFAYWFTGSVGLLSDAMESCVNLLAALVAFWMLSLAAKPPDDDHPYGHSKAEYFSSGTESVLIVLAAISIAVAAVPRLLHPEPIQQVGLGLGLTLAATAMNAIVAWTLLKAGHQLNSITLRADAHHLLTDVWTSVGVLLGILLVKATGWLFLDPLIALAVAANIIWAGFRLLRESCSGLLDQAIPEPEQRQVKAILERYEASGIRFHALRTRMAGARRFISLHVLVPDTWTVSKGHNLCDQLEVEIVRSLPHTSVITHLEPLDDPLSELDTTLDR